MYIEINETAELHLGTFDIRQFKSYETLHSFLWAGNATFTLVSKASQCRYTFNIHKSKFTGVTDNYFVSVLNGPNNKYDYLYLGMINPTFQTLRLTKGSKVSKEAPSYIAFSWFIRLLFSNPERLFALATIWHEGKCGRCGRKLTVPSSIEAGIGPECASKLGD